MLSKILVGLGVLSVILSLGLRLAWGQETLVFDTKEDWSAWSFPGGGVVELTDDGKVELSSVRKNINASLDASTFTYEKYGGDYTGGIRARSNPAAAAKIIDGDSTTFWAPDPDAEIDDWWVELDLGRAVTATKISMIFVEGKDPFPEFEVYVSDGIRRFAALPDLEYFFAYTTIKPNKERIFELSFDSEKDLDGNPLLGKFLQHVKIVFTRRVPDPGLAEIEVHCLGENIALGTLDRGGKLEAGTTIRPPVFLTDGKMWTYWVVALLGDDWAENGAWLRWDLGSQFWVDAIRILSIDTLGRDLDRSAADVLGFLIYVSDGTEAVRPRAEVWHFDGKNFVWDKVADVKNDTQVLQFDITFEPRRVRYILFHHFYSTGTYLSRAVTGAKISEMQIFGKGPVAGVTLQSPFIDLGESKNLTSVSWNAETPPGTRVEIRTRTGDAIVEETHYYDKSGNEITETAYNRKPPPLRGPVVIEKVPDLEYWSPWSPVYEAPGSRFLSPSPRRYMLIEARLISDDPKAAPSLDSITFSLTKPAAKELLGWIEPRSAEPGRPHTFRFSIKPSSGSGSTGFNEVLLTTPNAADSVVVRIGGREAEPSDIRATDDSLLVRLSQRVQTQLVEIQFRSTLFSYSTLFEAAVGYTGVKGLWQRVDPDPAMKNATAVMIPSVASGEDLIQNVSIEPYLLTPNDDGVNDELSIKFDVLKLDSPRRIRVAVYDLEGRLIRELYNQIGSTGHYTGIFWDGEGSAGIVQPGTYVLQVRVDGEAGKTSVIRAVAVGY